jgi:hypothetical protein
MNQTRSEPSEPQPIGREDTARDLRSWARGALATEAAVELLIGACHGRLVEPGWPWLPSDRGRIWFDATQIAAGTGWTVGRAKSESSLSLRRSCSAPHYMIWPGCWLDSTLAAWPWVLGAFSHAGGGGESLDDRVVGDQDHKSGLRPSTEREATLDEHREL